MLYSEPSNKQTVNTLRASINYKNSTLFKSKVLIPLHKAEFIYFNQVTKDVTLSPKGILKVETEIELEF